MIVWRRSKVIWERLKILGKDTVSNAAGYC